MNAKSEPVASAHLRTFEGHAHSDRMGFKRPLHQTSLRWIIAYLWSVPVALALSSALNWQYDGHSGWWIVAAYTAPILIFTEPLGSSVPDVLYIVVYCMALLALTASVVRATQLSNTTPNGS